MKKLSQSEFNQLSRTEQNKIAWKNTLKSAFIFVFYVSLIVSSIWGVILVTKWFTPLVKDWLIRVSTLHPYIGSVFDWVLNNTGLSAFILLTFIACIAELFRLKNKELNNLRGVSASAWENNNSGVVPPYKKVNAELQSGTILWNQNTIDIVQYWSLSSSDPVVKFMKKD